MVLGSVGIFVACVEFQRFFGGDVRFFITVVCFVILILGIYTLYRKRIGKRTEYTAMRNAIIIDTIKERGN